MIDADIEKIQKQKISRFFLFSAAVLLFGILLYTVQDIWNPIVALAALLLAVRPYRHEVWAKAGMRAAIFLVSVWLIYLLRDYLTPFILALGLAYILDPVVDGLCGKWRVFRKIRIKRWLATLLVVGLLVSLIVFTGAQLGTLIVSQADELASIVESAHDELQTVVESSWLQEHLTIQRIFTGLVEAVGSITESIPGLVRGLLSRIGVAVAGFFGGLLTVVLLFYALKDWDLLIEVMKENYLPASTRNLLDGKVADVDRIVKSFIKGYAITSIFVGLMTLLILFLFGFRGVAFLLAIITALLNIIPVIGFWISAAIILVVGVAKGLIFSKLVLVFVSLAALNVLEGNILQPKIIGNKVGLHPLLFMLSMAVFGKLLGITGVFIGVPLAAIISRQWQDYVQNRKTVESGKTHEK